MVKKHPLGNKVNKCHERLSLGSGRLSVGSGRLCVVSGRLSVGSGRLSVSSGRLSAWVSKSGRLVEQMDG